MLGRELAISSLREAHDRERPADRLPPAQAVEVRHAEIGTVLQDLDPEAPERVFDPLAVQQGAIRSLGGFVRCRPARRDEDDPDQKPGPTEEHALGAVRHHAPRENRDREDVPHVDSPPFPKGDDDGADARPGGHGLSGASYPIQWVRRKARAGSFGGW